jgi:limonene-1,2-epoxide hydrolase
MRTTNFILQLLDPANAENVLMDMHADGRVGFRQLFADQVVSNSVVAAYTGNTSLYVNPSYTGTASNYFKSLREACDTTSNLKERQQPITSSDAFDGFTGQRITSITQLQNNFFKGTKKFVFKTAFTNLFPDLLDRIHFRGSGRQKKQANIIRDFKGF